MKVLTALSLAVVLAGCAHSGAAFAKTNKIAHDQCEIARERIADRDATQFTEAQDLADHQKIVRRCDVIFVGLEELGELIILNREKEAGHVAK